MVVLNLLPTLLGLQFTLSRGVLELLSPTWQLSRTPIPAWAFGNESWLWELHSKTVFPLHSGLTMTVHRRLCGLLPVSYCTRNLRGLALKLLKGKLGKMDGSGELLGGHMLAGFQSQAAG